MMVELSEDELADVSGGDGNNNLLWGAGGTAIGAGAMKLYQDAHPIVQTQTVKKVVSTPTSTVPTSTTPARTTPTPTAPPITSLERSTSSVAVPESIERALTHLQPR